MYASPRQSLSRGYARGPTEVKIGEAVSMGILTELARTETMRSNVDNKGDVMNGALDQLLVYKYFRLGCKPPCDSSSISEARGN